jgi:hypothetical protein
MDRLMRPEHPEHIDVHRFERQQLRPGAHLGQ